MSHFVKITTLTDDGNFLRSWVKQDSIKELWQNSATQLNENKGSILFEDGEKAELIGFNETIESLG